MTQTNSRRNFVLHNYYKLFILEGVESQLRCCATRPKILFICSSSATKTVVERWSLKNNSWVRFIGALPSLGEVYPIIIPLALHVQGPLKKQQKYNKKSFANVMWLHSWGGYAGTSTITHPVTAATKIGRMHILYLITYVSQYQHSHTSSHSKIY